MRKSIVWFLVAAAAGGIFLFGAIASQRGVPVLAYHQVSTSKNIYAISPHDFAQQMAFLAGQGYQAVSLAELVAGFAGKGKLPDKPVVITFDDGYKDNLVQALPIMQRYGMKGTVFIITSQVGQLEYLTWEEIRQLHQQGTEIGSHSVSHVALGLSDEAAQKREIMESKKILEAKLGIPIEFLAYPYGSYNASSAKLLRVAGYQGACTGLIGLNTARHNPYFLRRISIPWPKLGLLEFRLRLWRAQLYALLGR